MHKIETSDNVAKILKRKKPRVKTRPQGDTRNIL